MELTKVDSNTLLSIGYEPDAELLELEFISGDIYDYHQVQPYLYMGLMSSDSNDIYFNKNIRDKYLLRKLKI